MANPVILRVRDEQGNIYDIPAIIGSSAYEIAVRDGFEGTEREWLDSLIGGIVDEEMSDESENPVRNWVIKAYIDGLIGDVETAVDVLRNIIGGSSVVDPEAATLALVNDLESMIGDDADDPTVADDPDATEEESVSAMENIVGVE